MKVDTDLDIAFRRYLFELMNRERTKDNLVSLSSSITSQTLYIIFIELNSFYFVFLKERFIII